MRAKNPYRKEGFRLFKPTYTSNGKSRTAARWYAEFMYQRQPRRLPGYTDERLTANLARKVVELARWRDANESPPPKLVQECEALSDDVRGPLERWGLVDERRTKTLLVHLDDFRKSLEARGNTPEHVRPTIARVKRIIDGCGFKRYGDISGSKVQAFAADLRKDRKGKGDTVKRGISAATFNYHLAAVKCFCRWMMKDGRVHYNPVEHLDGLNVKLDRRHDRRALSVDELRAVLDAAERGPERHGMAGPERALLYRLAVETGLRAGELRSLARASFMLDGDEPNVTIAAAYAKNRRQDTLPLRPATAAMLKAHLESKMPAAAAFTMPKVDRIAEMFRADLEAARQAWLRDAQTAQERADREGRGSAPIATTRAVWRISMLSGTRSFPTWRPAGFIRRRRSSWRGTARSR